MKELLEILDQMIEVSGLGPIDKTLLKKRDKDRKVIEGLLKKNPGFRNVVVDTIIMSDQLQARFSWGGIKFTYSGTDQILWGQTKGKPMIYLYKHFDRQDFIDFLKKFNKFHDFSDEVENRVYNTDRSRAESGWIVFRK